MDSACGIHSVSPKGDGTNAAASDRHSGTSPTDASAAHFSGARAGYLAGARSGDDPTLDELAVACVELSDAQTLAVLLGYRDGESVAETLARHAPAEQLSLDGRCARHPDEPKLWCLECKASTA